MKTTKTFENKMTDSNEKQGKKMASLEIFLKEENEKHSKNMKLLEKYLFLKQFHCLILRNVFFKDSLISINTENLFLQDDLLYFSITG